MILGNGHEICRFNIFKIKLIINTQMRGGFAISDFQSKFFLRVKYFIRALGGVLFNFISAFLAYKFFGFDFESLSGKNGIDLSTSFILPNVLLAAFNLIPYRISYQGVKIPNDGLNLLKIPFEEIKKLEKNIKAYDLFEAFEYYESKEYDRAIKIYEEYLSYDNKELAVIMNLSIMYIKKGNYDKALSLLKDNENLLNIKKNKNYRALYYNNLAWIYLIKQEIENADEYSKKAIELNSKENIFQGTRGAVLIENGKIVEGINILKKLVDFNFPNGKTLSAAIFLNYGYYLNRNIKKEEEMMNFISLNFNKLDLDEIELWEKIKERKKPSL